MTKTSISPNTLASAKNKFVKDNNVPSVAIAKQIIDGLLAAKAKQTTTEQPNAAQGA